MQALDPSVKPLCNRPRGGEDMTDVGELYECEICGNKVKVLEVGAGTLVCCGQPMNLVEA